ncbi:hypothetical protein ACVFI8_20860 [Agarivorans sp. MS3-6]
MTKLIVFVLLSVVATLAYAEAEKTVAASEAGGQTSSLSQQQITQLSYIAQDQNEPPQVRAQALQDLAKFPSQNALVAVVRGLKDSSSVIREAAINASEPYPLEHRWRMVSPLLNDDQQSVRVTAMINLVPDYMRISEEQRDQLKAPLAELIQYLEPLSDEDAQLLLADVYRWHNQWFEADKRYRVLLDSNSNNPDVWLSLADNYRAQRQDKQALEILDLAIANIPDTPSFHYSKALALVRLNDKASAADEIELAASLAEVNSYFWYLNGVLQEPFDIDKSVQSFEKAYLISGSPEQLYALCDIYVRHANAKSEACLDELAKVAPNHVINQLRAKA